MRPAKVTAAGPGNSPWLPVSYLQQAFNIGLYAMPSSDSAGPPAYKIQYAVNDAAGPVSVGITRAAGVATVVDPAHGLVTGDDVAVSGTSNPGMDGVFDVTVVDANTYTYVVPNSGNTLGAAPTVQRMWVFDHPTMTGLVTRASGNLSVPVSSVRLKVTTLTAGKIQLAVLQGSPL